MVKETSLKRIPCKPQDFMEVDFIINDAVSLRMHKALQVLTLTAGIREHLLVNDHKALNQAINAANEYITSYQQCTNS